jgi:hyaluronoglucosaminidase
MTSLFAVRGVIEGFYGNPWTHEQRLALIDFLGARGMNTFVYAPKDDPLLRRGWRVPYDGEALERLAALVARCNAAGMRLAWCISPGLSIRYSDPSDLDALAAKIRSVVALGVSRIGLFLDDIPRELQHPEDRAAFGDLAHAHVALVDRIHATLPEGTRLVVCPTVYWGTGTEPYVATLGEVDPRVDLFWTGRTICSPTLDLADAATFARTTNRPPTYWDNYPVNDVAMGYELHIGPYRGRDPHLWRASTGIVANGMELFEASRIPFATIADYLRDPEGYEPEASWRRAICDVVGEADLDAFALFADNVRSSCLSADDAPIVGAALESALFRLEHGDAAGAAADLGALADRLLAAAAHLLHGPVANLALIDECRPWLEGFKLGAQAIARIAELAAEGRLDADGPSELRPYLLRLRRARVRVFGDVLEMTLSVLSGTMLRPGEVP